MITLVPNNNTRVRVSVVDENSAGQHTAAAGLTVTIWVMDSPTATAAYSSMSYTAAELTDLPGDYSGTVLGSDVASKLTVDQEYWVRVFSGSVFTLTFRAIVRATRPA